MRKVLSLDQNEVTFDKVLQVNRVAKVVKGGRRFSFSALVVVGNQDGLVGFGLGKATEVPDAIKKASKQARKNLIHVPRKGSTIPHPVKGKFGAGLVILKPAQDGTGIIASALVRALAEACGVQNMVAKSLGIGT